MALHDACPVLESRISFINLMISFSLDSLVPQIARGPWKRLSPCVSHWASQWLPTKWKVRHPLSPFWESRWTFAGLS